MVGTDPEMGVAPVVLTSMQAVPERREPCLTSPYAPKPDRA